MNAKKTFSPRLTGLGQLLIPLIALALLLLFNLIRDPSFYAIGISMNNSGNPVFTGNLISIIDSASELAIIAMGMTLVTAACGGQDISVGAVGTISGSVFVMTLKSLGAINIGTVLLAALACCAVTVLFTAFNGALVAVFKIQPMIATLILFSCGRSIAYWIVGSATPQIDSPIISAMGMTIPGIPIPTPVFGVLLVGLILAAIFRFTSLRLYTQTVGINQGAARLNGINPVVIKLTSFLILGLCVAVAGIIGTSRMGQVNHKTLLIDIEMDAILAVAIGGNILGGGRFRISGSILGAYIIQMLTTTLLAMRVDPVNIKAYKAVVIIIIVMAGSPVIKARLSELVRRFRSGGPRLAAEKEAE